MTRREVREALKAEPGATPAAIESALRKYARWSTNAFGAVDWAYEGALENALALLRETLEGNAETFNRMQARERGRT